jgi:glutamine amidotransferase-like uncharacterized protein
VRFPHISASLSRCILFTVLLTAFGAAETAGPNLASRLYRRQISTGQIVASAWHGTEVKGANQLAESRGKDWVLIGVLESDRAGVRRLVYSNKSSKALEVSYYRGSTFLGSASLPALHSGWTGRAVADIDGNGNLDVIAANKSTGEIAVYFFGGFNGTTLLRNETIAALSAPGWNVIGAADLNGDGYGDLVLQEASTREVMFVYLTESNGLTVTGTQVLNGRDFRGWSAAGMQDMNGDSHPDLILTNDATGETIVNYYGGELGVASLGSDSVDRSGSLDWKIVVPSTPATATAKSMPLSSPTLSASALTASPDAAPEVQTLAATTGSTSTSTSAARVLIFNGSGTGASAVAAIENVVHSLGLAYQTVNSSQLDAMTQTKLASYKLFIVPGGNSIAIGNNLTSKATTTVRNAVSQNGLNYLGMCAGGFFGGFSSYHKVLNLTSGVWFKFFADYYNGKHKEAVAISFPARSKLDIYWQDGPQLSGWGKVVGKYPNGTPAITEGFVGKGFVILSGVHPEAPASWRTGMHFNTPVDVDLAYAATLVRSAMNRTMLPHF